MVESTATGRAKDIDLSPNPAFPKAYLAERRDITEELMVIRLEPEEGGAFNFKPGQYCTLGLGPIERAYSIASAPHENVLEVFVELVHDGELTPPDVEPAARRRNVRAAARQGYFHHGPEGASSFHAVNRDRGVAIGQHGS